MTVRTSTLWIVVIAAALAGTWLVGCSQPDDALLTSADPDAEQSDAALEPTDAANDRTDQPSDRQRGEPTPDPFALQRERMVDWQLRRRDISDKRMLEAMQTVPRHEFVPEADRDRAYADRPLPIGHGQTISQPYIVALMTQAAQPKPDSRVLDIGTGSGYQAAVIAELVKDVYSIEIICPLADDARRRLQRLGYDNVEVRCGDGYRGWPEHAPFDAIIVAAAPDHVPQPLIDQLATGGRLIIPVGKVLQELIIIEKQPDGTVKRDSVAPVRFVPMTGEAEK